MAILNPSTVHWLPSALDNSGVPVAGTELIPYRHSGNTYFYFTPTELRTFVTSSTLDLTSGQIKFPATQNPSSDPNTFDDYEEGTWTPVLNFGGGTTGITYAAQEATYTKYGDRVFWDLQIFLSNKGTDVGNATITGLPFTIGFIPGCCAIGTWEFITLNTGGGFYFPVFFINSTTITMLEGGSNVNDTQLTDADFVNNSHFRAGGHYKV